MRRTLFLIIIATAFLGAIAFASEGHGAAEAASSTVPLGLQGLKEVMNVHPLFVHFPISLLIMSAIFYYSGALFKKQGLLEAAKWELLSGTLFAVAAVWTGWQAANTIEHGEEVHRILMVHQNLGFMILVLSVVLSVWTIAVKASLPSKGRVLFLLAMGLLAAMIVQQGDLGGRMVFLHGAGVGQKSMFMEEAGHEHHSHETKRGGIK